MLVRNPSPHADRRRCGDRVGGRGGRAATVTRPPGMPMARRGQVPGDVRVPWFRGSLRSHLNQRRPVVEEVAQRPSRDPGPGGRGRRVARHLRWSRRSRSDRHETPRTCLWPRRWRGPGAEGRAGALVSRLAALAPQPAAGARAGWWSRRSRSDRHETPGMPVAPPGRGPGGCGGQGAGSVQSGSAQSGGSGSGSGSTGRGGSSTRVPVWSTSQCCPCGEDHR